jgi:hypothetical protein
VGRQVRGKDCLPEEVGISAGVPQIAADFPALSMVRSAGTRGSGEPVVPFVAHLTTGMAAAPAAILHKAGMQSI